MLWTLSVGACAPAPAGETSPEPSIRLARPLQLYREQALITGDADFPAVASVATLAGPADSTLLLFGLSLPASALRFQRAQEGFAASYVVSIRAVRDSQIVGVVDRRERVRVQGFDETDRTDESVLFQTRMTLAPGEHTLTVRVRDGLSARGFEVVDTLDVPAYGGAGRILAAPVSVYRAVPRQSRDSEPDLVLNPRHTVPYGRAGSTVYVEAYGAAPIRLELIDGSGGTIWTRTLEVGGDQPVAALVVALPSDSLPLGRLSLRATAAGDTTRPVPILVTLTDQWAAANFEEVAGLLRYIATAEELEGLLEASPAQRRDLWDAFWEARDPIPATPVNEYRDAFFERIRVATMEFAEPPRPGWQTDRGEVYIVLGPPSRLTELRSGIGVVTGQGRAQEWMYDNLPGGGRIRLIFVDRYGFGTYRLTEESAMEFRAVARRVQHPKPR